MCTPPSRRVVWREHCGVISGTVAVGCVGLVGGVLRRVGHQLPTGEGQGRDIIMWDSVPG